MNRTVCRLPGWLAGAALATAGLVVAAPGTPAYACGEQGIATPVGGSLHSTWAAGTSPVRVSGGGLVAVPAGGTAPLAVTVDNAGGGFRGSIVLEARTSGPAGLPGMTVEQSVDSATSRTWRRLPEEGTAGARWFTADGVNFHPGQRTEGFRLGVALAVPGSRLRITAHVRDQAAREVGATTFDVTVAGAALRVRTTFPAELRRGGTYREFFVEVRNPSAVTYRHVGASLSMTGLTGRPNPREAGYLAPDVIRVEHRTDGGWRHLAVRSGCDPVFTAALGEPFDLRPGASRTVHLRIRLESSPATKPLHASYSVSAAPAGNADAYGTVGGELLIRPRLVPAPGPTGGPKPTGRPTPTGSSKPTDGAWPVAPTTDPPPQPPAAALPPAAAPPGLPHTGAPVWPLAGVGAVVLLGGAGALVASRRRLWSR